MFDASIERLEPRRLLAAQPNLPPAAPAITEPTSDGAVVSGADVHMVTGPFSDPNAGDVHRRSASDDLERCSRRQIGAGGRAIEGRGARPHAGPIARLRADVAAAGQHDDAGLATGVLASHARAHRHPVHLETNGPPVGALRRDP